MLYRSTGGGSRQLQGLVAELALGEESEPAAHGCLERLWVAESKTPGERHLDGFE